MFTDKELRVTWFSSMISKVLGGSAEDAPDTLLSAEAFTQVVERLFQDERPHLRVQIVGVLQIQFDPPGVSGAPPARMNLHNIYQHYLNEPGRLGQILEDYKRVVDSASASDDQPWSSADILPMLRPTAYLDEIQRQHATSASQKELRLIADAIAEDLVVVYVIDRPAATQVLTEGLLGKGGVKLEDVRSLALDNLRRKAADFEVQTLPGLPGISIIMGDGNYETALLLLDEYWNTDRFPVEDELVVAVPARGRVFAIDSARGIGGLAGIARGVYNEGVYSISPLLYVRREGRWETYPVVWRSPTGKT